MSSAKIISGNLRNQGDILLCVLTQFIELLAEKQKREME